jgi:hypothetical protein
LIQGARIRPASYLGVSLWNRGFAQAGQEFILRDASSGHSPFLEQIMNNVNKRVRRAQGATLPDLTQQD